ncbi:hypothetical protein EMN47_19060 [Prolixibacteraceae bacterium JC049]|nr:hypothetical protein [Prolixibacteraceae bacterium JC049]
MKQLLLTMAIILGVGLGSYAQQAEKELPPAKERAEMQTAIMKEKMELTDDQEVQVMEVNLRAAKRMDEMKQLTDKMKKFKTFRSIISEKDKALKKILTKEQFKMYEKSKKEMKKLLKEKSKERKK